MRNFTLLFMALFLGTATFAQNFPDPIVDQPEGKLYEHLIVKSGALGYSWLSDYYDASTDAAFANIVEGTDGNLYIQNMLFIYEDANKYWVKAEAQPDGSYLIRKQLVGAGDNSNYYISVLEYDEEDGYFYEEENPAFSVTWNDGVLKVSDDIHKRHAFGIVYDDVNEETGEVSWGWLGFCLWGYEATIMTETYNVLPEDAKTEQMVLRTHNDNVYQQQFVEVAFVGNEFFFHPYADLPGWAKGTIEGNKITIRGGQYMGFDETLKNFAFLHVGEPGLVEDEYYGDITSDITEIYPEIVLDYNPEAKTIMSDMAFTIDNSRDQIYYCAIYTEPYFYCKPEETPAYPMDPTFNYIFNYRNENVTGLLGFTVPNMDVNGVYIYPEKMSLLWYFDSETEPYVFTPDLYTKLEGPMTEIPYFFTDDYDISYKDTRRFVSLNLPIADVAGLQVIYRGGGEVHKSNIVLYDIHTKDVRIIPAGDDIPTGIQGSAEAKLRSTELFDLTGRPAARSARGIFVQRQTYSDGTTTIRKIRR